MKETIILLGGGGHCKSCIDVIEKENRFTILGILDMADKIGEKMAGYPVIGTDDDLPTFARECDHFLITVGHIQSAAIRIKLFQRLTDLGLSMPVIISPHAVVSKKSSIGPGTIIMHQAVVNTEARIESNCIINTGALIEHESRVGSHTHISTYAILNGQCRVGDACFIGSRTVLANNIDIVSSTIVAAGSVVLRSLDQPGTYIGNPLRKIR